jgi:VanZ family protein
MTRTKAYRLTAVLMLLISLVALSVPGTWVEGLQTYFYQWWPWPSSGIASTDIPVDKVIHAALFSLCACLFVRGWTVLRHRWWFLCAALLVYGVLTEWIQSFVPGRSASIADIVADGLGIGIGVGVARFYLRRRNDSEKIISERLRKGIDE